MNTNIDLENPSNISFEIDGVEFLRLEPNGDAYVKGNLVANDIEVYEGFVAWLKKTQK